MVFRFFRVAYLNLTALKQNPMSKPLPVSRYDKGCTRGAVPAPKKYVCVGQRKSSRPSNRARIVRIWAHSVPTLDYAPPKRDESEAYYFRPGVRVGNYRVKY